MKTLKSVAEFILNVWAAIVKILFPRYCVKCLILKTRKNAWRYCPGSEKELCLINELKLFHQDIAARVWSHETKVELIRRGCDALLSEVKTEEVLDIIIEKQNTSNLIKAMRFYTPSREKMREIFSYLTQQSLCALAKEVPWVFETFKAQEILETYAKRKEYKIAAEWEFALTLAEARPMWAVLFMKELRKVSPQNLGEKGEELMKKFFNIAFDARLDIAEMMPYLYVFFPELYERVRENFSCYKEISPYFEVLFPQLVKYLTKDFVRSMDDICVTGKLSDKDNAYAWLRIGFERMNERDVYQVLIEQIFKIKKHVMSSLFDQLFKKLVKEAKTYNDLVRLYRVADTVDKDIVSALLCKAEGKVSGASLRFAFPFAGWDDRFVIRAIEAMVVNKEFPVECIGQLSDDMQKVAFEIMETMSQIEAIDNGDITEIIDKVTFYPRAERHLLSSRVLEKYQCAYIERVKVDASTISWVIKTIYLSLKQKKTFIFTYAKKWGLTKDQYMQIMQSNLASEASILKRYLL